MLGDGARLEVVHRPELELDQHLGAVTLKRVFDLEAQRGTHPAHDLVKVVAIDLDEFPVLERRQRLGRLAREVAEYADHEG